MDTLQIFSELLQLAVETAASDVHIKSNKPAYLRISGSLEPVDMDALGPEQIQEFIEKTVPDQFFDDWRRERQVDYSYREVGIGRFRVNGFYQRSLPGIVFRHVSDNPPNFGSLNHDPKVFQDLCKRKNGIVLICGATGSGKSSTLAAMIEHINQSMDRHIVTLEDPIEFTFTDAKSIINQREIGLDTPSFAHGMRSVLRQDPDVILVGEMRDRDTFETAIRAAETGHLVFGTLHASNAQQAVQRLFEFFPPDQQVSMRRQIAAALNATITQRLIPSLEGKGRLPVCEVLVVDSLAAKIIQDGTYEKIHSAIEAGKDNGSKSFNRDLLRLVQEGKIAKSDAIDFSPNPRQLEMNLQGIFLSEGGLVS